MIIENDPGADTVMSKHATNADMTHLLIDKYGFEDFDGWPIRVFADNGGSCDIWPVWDEGRWQLTVAVDHGSTATIGLAYEMIRQIENDPEWQRLAVIRGDA